MLRVPTTSTTSTSTTFLPFHGERRYSHTSSLQSSDLDYKWNSEQEQQVKNWGEMALTYHIMHSKTARYYQRKYNYLNTASTILVGLVSIIEFVTVTQSFFWIKIISGVLSGISFILMRIQNSYKYHERSRRHSWAMTEYDSLYMEIVEQLNYTRDRRMNVRVMMRMIKKTLKALKRVSPDIPEHIQDKYVQDVGYALEHFPIRIVSSNSGGDGDGSGGGGGNNNDNDNDNNHDDDNGGSDDDNDSEDDIDHTFSRIIRMVRQEKNMKKDGVYLNHIENEV